MTLADFSDAIAIPDSRGFLRLFEQARQHQQAADMLEQSGVNEPEVIRRLCEQASLALIYRHAVKES